MLNKKEYMKEYNQLSRVKIQNRINSKKYAQTHREQIKEYRKTHKIQRREWAHKKNKERKQIVISYYSEGKSECACCGEKHIEFLSINHLNGGGNKHRKEINLNKKYNWGNRFYQWLIKNSFPEGYNVLCYNCNMALGFLKYCPHQIKLITSERGEVNSKCEHNAGVMKEIGMKEAEGRTDYCAKGEAVPTSQKDKPSASTPQTAIIGD